MVLKLSIFFMKDKNLSFAAIAGIMKPYYVITCAQKKEGKVVRFLMEIFYISFLYLCLCGGVLHVWEMTEI